jgi:Zn-dependent peptidase ImmA (M78 family)
MKISELNEDAVKIKNLDRFAKWACEQLGIDSVDDIKYGTDMEPVKTHRTFGSTKPDGAIWVHIKNRNTADIMRTLCHELVHRHQFEIGTAAADMSEDDRQRIEDEANAIAGRMMREYGRLHSTIYDK